MEPTEIDIGWTAGVVDGEGSIGAYHSKHSQRPHSIWTLRVSVANTDERMLIRLRKLWGGNYLPISSSKGYRTHYVWRIQGHKACDFLRLIYKALVIKKEQADVALKFGALLQSRLDKRCVNDNNIQKRQELSEQLKYLKIA